VLFSDEYLGLNDHTGFNVDRHGNFSLLHLDKNGTVWKSAYACPPLVMGIDIEMNIHADIDVAFSLAISGTIVPPNFDEFKFLPGTSIRVNGWACFV
jgi:hypothetical protein